MTFIIFGIKLYYFINIFHYIKKPKRNYIDIKISIFLVKGSLNSTTNMRIIYNNKYI
jgi:hypothetical protein